MLYRLLSGPLPALRPARLHSLKCAQRACRSADGNTSDVREDGFTPANRLCDASRTPDDLAGTFDKDYLGHRIFASLVSKRRHRVDPGSPPRRKIACQDSNHDEHGRS